MLRLVRRKSRSPPHDFRAFLFAADSPQLTIDLPVPSLLLVLRVGATGVDAAAPASGGSPRFFIMSSPSLPLLAKRSTFAVETGGSCTWPASVDGWAELVVSGSIGGRVYRSEEGSRAGRNLGGSLSAGGWTSLRGR